MYVLEWIIVAELALLLFMGAMWLIAQKPEEDKPGEPAYRISRGFWRIMLEQKSLFVAMPIDADRPFPGMLPDDDMYAAKPVDPAKVAVIPVVVVPESSCDQIVGMQDDAIKMLVSAPISSGQANKAVMQLLVEILELQSFQVQLIRGHYNARKIVQITGMTRADIDKKLSSFL